MKRLALTPFLVLALAACGPNQPCPSCDDGADDDVPADVGEVPDLPCGGADLQTDDFNCGTCGNICSVQAEGTDYQAGGCVDGACDARVWLHQDWPEPSPLTCAEVCTTASDGEGSCAANGCSGLTAFVCETMFTEECDVLHGGSGPQLVDFSGTCEELIPWPEFTYGGKIHVFCCCE